jgi:hypothetical protein
MKNREKVNLATLKECMRACDKYQSNFEKWVIDQSVVKSKIEQMQKDILQSTDLINDSKIHTAEIQKKIKNDIKAFKAEYKEGYKRIVNCDIQQSHIKSRILFLENERKNEKLKSKLKWCLFI